METQITINKMSIAEKRNHISLIVRQEGFEDFMIKVRNKYIHSASMKQALNRIK